MCSKPMRDRHELMQDTNQVISPPSTIGLRGGGGRAASEALRASHALCGRFAGLEEGESRYRLMLLVKKAGKLAGFSRSATHLLEYYLAFTRDQDWEEGSRPIVYQSVTKTALDLGVSERQVQKLEAALFHAGAISWNDSGNHKRYGRRCPDTGRLVFGYGVDLSPLAFLRTRLESILDQKERDAREWLETKRQISWWRGQLRGMLLEAREGNLAAHAEYGRRYKEIAHQIRSNHDLPRLQDLLARHKDLYNDLVTRAGGEADQSEEAPRCDSVAKETSIGSRTSEKEFAHKEITNQGSSDESDTSSLFEGACGQRPTRALPISLGMAIRSAGPRLREHLDEQSSWSDLIDAAHRVRACYGISQQSWGEACSELGRHGAALCLLLVDRGSHRAKNRVRCPAAYFRALIGRARGGELQLHRSICGGGSNGSWACSRVGAR